MHTVICIPLLRHDVLTSQGPGPVSLVKAVFQFCSAEARICLLHDHGRVSGLVFAFPFRISVPHTQGTFPSAPSEHIGGGTFTDCIPR